MLIPTLECFRPTLLEHFTPKYPPRIQIEEKGTVQPIKCLRSHRKFKSHHFLMQLVTSVGNNFHTRSTPKAVTKHQTRIIGSACTPTPGEQSHLFSKRPEVAAKPGNSSSGVLPPPSQPPKHLTLRQRHKTRGLISGPTPPAHLP